MPLLERNNIFCWSDSKTSRIGDKSITLVTHQYSVEFFLTYFTAYTENYIVSSEVFKLFMFLELKGKAGL